MSVPEITHLQFLVLAILEDGELPGREVRERMEARGERKSGPAFYQFMSRLEDGGFVEGWYDQKVVQGQLIKERRYKITGLGSTAMDDTRRYYLDRGGLGLLGA